MEYFQWKALYELQNFKQKTEQSDFQAVQVAARSIQRYSLDCLKLIGIRKKSVTLEHLLKFKIFITSDFINSKAIKAILYKSFQNTMAYLRTKENSI